MGVAERKQREKQARIATIKKSASWLFERKGFESTTMSEIAERAEISTGSIYLFFKSKEELLYTLREPYIDELVRKMVKITNNNREKADQTLRKLANVFFRTYRADPDPFLLIMDYNAEKVQPLYSEENHKRFQEAMRKNIQSTEAVVARGIKQGIFKPVNPRVTSILIWNSFMGIIKYDKNRTVTGKKSYLKPTLNEAITLILEGLIA